MTPSATQPDDRSEISGYAIASVILGLVWIFGVGSLASVLCGHRAVSTIGDSGGRLYGVPGARIGLAIGYIGLVFGAVFWLVIVSGA